MQTFQALAILLLHVVVSGCLSAQEDTWEIYVKPLSGEGVMYFVSGDNGPIKGFDGIVVDDTTKGDYKTIKGNKNITIEMGSRSPGGVITVMKVKRNGVTVFDSEKMVWEGEAWTVKL